MTFLLDNCVWRPTETILKNAGFKCITLRILGRCDAANGQVISLAKTHKAILLTRDRDFSDFALYPPGSHNGIVLLRITPQTMDAVHTVLINALRTVPVAEIPGSLIIITSTTFRLHKAK